MEGYASYFKRTFQDSIQPRILINYNGKKKKVFRDELVYYFYEFVSVMADYIALPLLIEKTETGKPTVTENGKTEKVGQSESASCCKSKKASAEDWAKVNANRRPIRISFESTGSKTR